MKTHHVLSSAAVISCAALASLAAAPAARATVAVTTQSALLVITPTETIDNAFAVVANETTTPPVGAGTGSYNVSGQFVYLGNLSANSTETVTATGLNPNGTTFGTVVGLAPPVGSSTSQDVVLGLGASAASSAITNSTPLTSFTNYLSTLIQPSFSYTASNGFTYTVSGIAISATDPKSSVDQILNGTYPATLTITASGSVIYGQATNVIPYTVTLPFVGTVPVVTVGSDFNFSFSGTGPVSADLNSNAISLGSSGSLVDFDSPTNVGTISVSNTPEPASLAVLGIACAGALALARRRRRVG